MKRMQCPVASVVFVIGAALAPAVSTPASPFLAVKSLGPTQASQLVTAMSRHTACPYVTGPQNVPYLINQMVRSDGVAVPFAIPRDQVFVITSFDFGLGGLEISRTGYGEVSLTAYDSAGTAVDLLRGAAPLANGVAVGAVVVPNGVAVRPDKILCVTAFDGVSRGMIHGFFAPDR